jgi:hypothetical protein
VGIIQDSSPRSILSKFNINTEYLRSRLFFIATMGWFRNQIGDCRGLKYIIGAKAFGYAPATNAQLLGAVYTCPNLRTNRRTIPCTICTQTEEGANYFSFSHCNGWFSHFSQKISKISLLDTLGSKSYTESYGDSYGKSHV